MGFIIITSIILQYFFGYIDLTAWRMVVSLFYLDIGYCYVIPYTRWVHSIRWCCPESYVCFSIGNVDKVINISRDIKFHRRVPFRSLYK